MNKHYHFIGIGGIGMGALAHLLLEKGCKVSGSDLRPNQVTDRLAQRGAAIFIGHAANNVGDAHSVVYSSAVRADNPELAQARLKKIPVLQRARLLAELMQGQIGITVAGAHGKTTTTSMVAGLLVGAGLHPTTAVGGIVHGAQSHARLGQGQYFVTEVDESDGTFLFFNPRYSIITNIDLEHVDYYRDWKGILDAYRKFIGNTAPEGIIFACGDDAPLSELLAHGLCSVRTYGLSSSNDIYADNILFDGFVSRFDCTVDGKKYGQIRLGVPGRHNVVNALACVGLGLSLSIGFNVIRENLGRFAGVQRRFQLKNDIGDILVIDDYAHHPTEIRAVIETARRFQCAPESSSLSCQPGRLVTVFQPHRFTRVSCLFEEFAQSLAHGDCLIVTDIYAASEQPIEGITAQRLCDRIRALTSKPVIYLEKEKIVDYVQGFVRPGDLVLTLGAGDITYIADDLARALRQRQTMRVEEREPKALA